MEDRYILWHFSLPVTCTYATTISKKSFVKYHDNYKSFSPAPNLCHHHHGGRRIHLSLSNSADTTAVFQIVLCSHFLALEWGENLKDFFSFRKNGTRQLAAHSLDVFQNTISFRLVIQHLNKLNGASTCNYCSGSRIDCKESCPKTARSWTCKPSSCYITAFPCQLCFQSTFILWKRR
jgi:hypothetical protein